jgi:hypothetical protein
MAPPKSSHVSTSARPLTQHRKKCEPQPPDMNSGPRKLPNIFVNCKFAGYTAGPLWLCGLRDPFCGVFAGPAGLLVLKTAVDVLTSAP